MMMKLKLIFSNAISLLFLLGAASSVAAQQTAEPPLITVSGQAELRVAPDEVDFKLEVEKVDKNLAVAKQQNDEVLKQILALARRHQIEPQNVQTDYISVEPRYTNVDDDGEPRTAAKREFLGYAVSKTVVIRLKDISRFESLFSDLLGAGVTQVRDVDFHTTAIRKYKDQARALAIRAAREKAVALAGEIGQPVGRAYSIREEGDGYGSASNSNFTANATSSIRGDFSDSESTFAPGMITVRSRVTVSFRLD